MSFSRSDVLGQLVFLRSAESRWDSSRERLFRAYRPAGIVLSARELKDPESVAELLGKIHATARTLPFLAPGADAAEDPRGAFPGRLPSPRSAARKGLPVVARLGKLTGEALRLLGFNTAFAPVLDLSTRFTARTLEAYALSSDPDTVARCGEAFLRGLRSQGILACSKHFPGFGAAEIDKHSRWPVINKTMAQLWREDLVPYRALLPRLPMVMVSHGVYRAYDFDPELPAMLSINIVEGLLRLKLGYGGVAVADNLEAYAVRAGLDPGEVAVRSLNAGCDLLLIKEEGSVERIFAALAKNLTSGRLPARRVKQALIRIRRVKKVLRPPSGKIPLAAYERLARQIDTLAVECRPAEQKIA